MDIRRYKIIWFNSKVRSEMIVVTDLSTLNLQLGQSH